MSYWGKIIGGMAGFAMGGPFGAMVGAALGHAADSGTGPQLLRNFTSFGPGGAAGFGPARVAAMFAQRDQLFAIGVVVLSAKLAKCDGPVSRVEIDAFKRSFRIPGLGHQIPRRRAPALRLRLGRRHAFPDPARRGVRR